MGGPGRHITLVSINSDGKIKVESNFGGWWADMWFSDLDNDGISELITSIRAIDFERHSLGEMGGKVMRISKWNGKEFEYKCTALEPFFSE